MQDATDAEARVLCRDTKSVLCLLMRGLFAAGGFHRVHVKGRQAAAKEAPVLALAPHSSYFDALPVVCLGAPSVVAKGETGYLPFFGSTLPRLSCMDCAVLSTPVCVDCEENDCRKMTFFLVTKKLCQFLVKIFLFQKNNSDSVCECVVVCLCVACAVAS